MTQAELKDLFDYLPTGTFARRKPNRRGMAFKTKNLNGYLVFVFGKRWLALHRAIYVWHHGHLPEQVDHINRDKLDNRIENLRPASRAQNSQNRDKYKNSLSKYKGVCPWKSRFSAYIRVNKKQIHLGLFDSAKDAARVYDGAALKYFGEYARLNFPGGN